MQECMFLLTHILSYKDGIIDSILIWVNTGQQIPVFSYFLCSDVLRKHTGELIISPKC